MRRVHAIVMILVALFGCEASPAPPKAIQARLLESFQAEFVETGELLPEVITLKRSSGKYIETRMIPSVQMPEDVDGKPVQKFGQWPMAFLVYSIVKVSSDPQTTVLFLEPYSAGSIAAPPSGPDFLPVACGINVFSSTNGYSGPPKALRKLREGEFARWTYLNVPRSITAKELAYELVA